MNQTNVKLIVGDFMIAVLFAILPGIRGYSNWQIHEYLFWVLMSVILMVAWYKKNRQLAIK